jgi:hypothetical protein
MRFPWYALVPFLTAISPTMAQQNGRQIPNVPPIYYQSPGLYGMAYGTPSFGYPRTYSNFSSPYGGGFAYGYAPYGLMPGPFGVELWRPGVAVPGYVYGSSYYYTYSYPARVYAPQPPVGVYAPGFGPPFYRGP